MHDQPSSKEPSRSERMSGCTPSDQRTQTPFCCIVMRVPLLFIPFFFFFFSKAFHLKRRIDRDKERRAGTVDTCLCQAAAASSCVKSAKRSIELTCFSFSAASASKLQPGRLSVSSSLSCSLSVIVTCRLSLLPAEISARLYSLFVCSSPAAAATSADGDENFLQQKMKTMVTGLLLPLLSDFHCSFPC